jgi:hypothetical protein
MLHVLKLLKVSLLRECIKFISRGDFYMHLHMQTDCLKFNVSQSVHQRFSFLNIFHRFYFLLYRALVVGW